MADTNQPSSRQQAWHAYAMADTWARRSGADFGDWDEEGHRRALAWLPVGLPALSATLKHLREAENASGEAVGDKA